MMTGKHLIADEPVAGAGRFSHAPVAGNANRFGVGTPALDDAQAMMPIRERKAGRLRVCGLPTGVEANETLVHGGLRPASIKIGGASFGTVSIRRSLRLACNRNLPAALLTVVS